ncbi:cation transport regulator-like protein 2 [Stipitochalara longipes BDJ]|nr:cation transport regulator-like protein 2 [Stipitochalara longipes BDJ]
MPAPSADSDAEFWLFGYGSLIWKPPPHYDRRIPGYVTGYVRRFWQDHRGTPESPGRVVTLIERSFWETLTDHHDSAEEKVWGTAYRIEAPKVAEVQEYLDIREINGYTIHYTGFHPSDGSPTIKTLVYIGTPENDQFVGPQPPQELAEHIYRSIGPSGPNKDYLLSLEEALDSLSADSGDGHVKDLATRVRKLEHETSGVGDQAVNDMAIANESMRVGSTDEQEETEK